MSDPYRTIRHLAFFEALGSLEEGSADWHATTAGLVVLRMVDAWYEEGAHVAAADAWGLNAVREAVAAMTAGDPARTILGGVVDAVAAAERADFSVVATRLSAYGRALHFDAKWRLAADVYETLLAYAHPIDESDVYINASMQLGYCLRMLGEFDQAAVAYADAGRVATSMGDVAFANTSIGSPSSRLFWHTAAVAGSPGNCQFGVVLVMKGLPNDSASS